jgi:Zn-dependent protease with chaperone function
MMSAEAADARRWPRRRFSVNIARFVGATVAALVLLVLLNMFVFPLIFPGGVASKFANARPTPLITLHLAAFLATAVLLTVLCTGARLAKSSLAAAGIGALAGLLAALPSTLHTNAMAHVPVSGEVAAVLWTTVSWALAAGVAHRAYSWHRERPAR